MRRAIVWGLPALVWAGFSLWYTDCGGPLTEQEIGAWVAELEARDAPPRMVESLRRFMENDSGRQFLMLNAIDLAEDPPDVEGAAPGESAEQLMGRYMEHMYAQLFRRACHPVVYGYAVNPAMDIVGIDGAEQWTAGALMRYRSRRSFMEVVAHPDTRGRHEFKVAAMEKTIAYPIETVLYLGDPRLILGLLFLAGAALADLVTGRRPQGPPLRRPADIPTD